MLKRSSWFVLTTALSAVMFVGCQPKPVEVPEEKPVEQKQTVVEEPLKLTGQLQRLTWDMPNCKGKNCPDISIERLNSNQPFVDAYIDDQILKQLQNTVDLGVTTSLKALDQQGKSSAAAASDVEGKDDLPSKNALEQKAMPYIHEFLRLDNELKALSSSQHMSMMIKPNILNAMPPLVTVVLNSSQYLGGAHGSSSQQYFHFDLETQKRVELKDIVQKKQYEALEKQAYAAFQQWVKDNELSNDIQDYEQVWKFKLSSNFYLGKQGLILQYAEYEIGPYVVGLPRLVLPYENLTTILKPKYLPEDYQKQPQPEKVEAQTTQAAL